jgi:hypothetical protein
VSAVPVIPASIATPAQLDAWIEEAAPQARSMADRLRLIAAVIERAGEIGERQRAAAGAGDNA